MNRGFAFYFKNALKSSASTIWKGKHALKVWAYFLVELVARITIIFSAYFDLADIRQAKLAQEGRADIPETLKVAAKGKPAGTMILAIIAEAFIFLGGALLIAAATGILYLIGYIVSGLVTVPWYTVYLFCVPGGLALLVYATVMVLILSPTPYIIETNPELSVSEVIKICFETMKGRGKLTAFLNFFIPTILELIMVAICGGGGYAVYLFVPLRYKFIAYAGCIILSAVLLLLTVPMFDLAKKIAQKSLFADIALDPANGNKRTAGINIKNCNGIKFQKSEIKENLAALFDETQSDSVPAPDSPARRKIKEQAEKAALSRQKPLKEQTEVKQPVAAREIQPAQTAVPAQPEPEFQPSEQTEPVSVRSVMEQLNEPVGGDTEEFDLDKFVPEKFDLDKFIDSQVAEAGYAQAHSEPAEQIPAEPAVEQAAPDGEQPAVEQAAPEPQPEEPAAQTSAVPAAEKPKRTRTAKPKTEGETTPKRTRTVKPKTGEPAEANAEGGEVKPKRTRTTRKTVENTGDNTSEN